MLCAITTTTKDRRDESRRRRGRELAATWKFRGDESRRRAPRPRRGYSAETSRGDAARPRRGYSVETSRGDGRRGRDVAIPWRKVAATPRPRRGYSVIRLFCCRFPVVQPRVHSLLLDVRRRGRLAADARHQRQRQQHRRRGDEEGRRAGQRAVQKRVRDRREKLRERLEDRGGAEGPARSPNVFRVRFDRAVGYETSRRCRPSGAGSGAARDSPRPASPRRRVTSARSAGFAGISHA